MEVDSGNLSRARSVFERSLAIDYTYIPLWHRYAQVEARNKQFGHASAVLDRATSLLPLESKLWLQYLEYEEIRGDINHCRDLFKKWSQTGASEVWKLWYMFETRHSTNRRKEDLLRLSEEWTRSCPDSIDAWVAYASNVNPEHAVKVYTAALESGSINGKDRSLLIQLRSQTQPGGDSIDLKELRTKNVSIQDLVEENGGDIDMWWASVNDANESSLELLQEATERCSPRIGTTKSLAVRRYALLWLRLALVVEKRNLDMNVEQIYEQALNRWDHSKMTSVTIWRNYAYYFLRNGKLDLCRKVFGSALRKTRANPLGNQHVLRDYIALEKRLLETERVRKLYGLLCSNWPQSSTSWIEFAQFELELNEFERANFLFKAALNLPSNLDDGDALWKEWAETVANVSLDSARDVWEQAILNGNDRADLYAEYAMFELGTGLDDESEQPDISSAQSARSIFERGLTELKSQNEADNVPYLQLMDLFLQFEESYGTEESYMQLQKRASGSADVSEKEDISENPDSSSESDSYSETSPESKPSLSAVQQLLANAHKWKESQV